MVYFISSENFVPHFGHPKVYQYETFVWTPCFQILAKTMPSISAYCGQEMIDHGNTTNGSQLSTETPMKYSRWFQMTPIL